MNIFIIILHDWKYNRNTNKSYLTFNQRREIFLMMFEIAQGII